jgi:hypothetical protein
VFNITIEVIKRIINNWKIYFLLFDIFNQDLDYGSDKKYRSMRWVNKTYTGGEMNEYMFITRRKYMQRNKLMIKVYSWLVKQGCVVGLLLNLWREEIMLVFY